MDDGAGTPIAIAEAALGAIDRVPDVIGLDAGPLGAIATYGGGRRVRGVTVTRIDGVSHISLRVRARFGATLPELGTETRRAVEQAVAGAGAAGPLVVDIEIVDVAIADG